MKIKLLSFGLTILLCSLTTNAQVGVGNTNPQAQLDISASDTTTPTNTDGILIPRVENLPTVGAMTANQDGMMVFYTGTAADGKGFYYWNNTTTSWEKIASGGKNTLDEAYDEGGAGNGKTINADNGSVRINGTDGFLVTGTVNSGNTIDSEISGAGTRMFFNPRKAAFRAGSINGNQWDDANIGDYSFATGYNTTAAGDYSIAMGRNSNAMGELSVAIGPSLADNAALATNALGSRAVAIGGGAEANANFSVAIGTASTASGNSSFALSLGGESFSYGETVLGTFPTEYTPNSISGWDANDRIFTIGNGFDGGPPTRSNALTIYKSGLMNINDEYNMPLTAGSANQIMAIDNSGQVNFVNASTVFNDNQFIDTFALVGSQLGLSIQNDGQPIQIVDLSSIDTDNQQIDVFNLNGTNLEISLQDDGQPLQTVDLSSLNNDDADWYEEGTTNAPNNINDNIFTQGRVAIGTNSSNTLYNLTSESLAGNTQVLIGNRSNGEPGAEIEVTGAGANGLRINLAGAQNSSNRYAVEANVSGGLRSRLGFLDGAPVNALVGQRNDMTMGGFYTYRGMHNLFSGTSTDPALTHHGVYNYLTGNISGLFRGVENRILGGGGNKTGLYNFFGNNAGGFLIGHSMTVSGSNNSAGYIAGLTVSIPSTVTATNQYGIYSDVTRANGYSGYFLGRVSIGTTTANNYILPGTRGTNGYVIQSTGGTGTTWADPTSLGTDDQNIQSLGFNAATNILTVGIENGAAQTVNLSALDSGGDITNINAGNGLTGGGTSGSITINAVGTNGITTNANDFRLGGNLIQNTTINQNAFDLNFNLTSAAGNFTVDTNTLVVESSGDTGFGIANPAHPLHIVDNVASEREGIYIDKNDNTTQETNGIYVEKTGSGTGRSHAIRTRNDGTGTGQKYGVFNTISATSSGSQYGTRNFLAGASPSGQFGTFNNLDNSGTGNHYGIYNGMRGASAANLYGVYNEFERAYTSPADVVGVRNRFTNGIPGTNGMSGVWTDFTTPTNGNFYGTRNEFTNTATGTGNKYGTYNIFSASAGGTHYGTYNSVSVADGWAGYFLGRNYISQRLSIGETDNANSSLNIRRNSGSSNSHIELREAGGNDGARIRFSNTVETVNEWVLYGRADNTLADNSFNFFHSSTGNILEIKGDGDVEVNGQVGININNPTYAIMLPNSAAIATGRGRANAWTTYSDSRVKSDQQVLKNGLSLINQMSPKTYFHHDGNIENGVLNLSDSGEQTLGFIAQELYKVFPEAVQKPVNENETLWSVDYDKVIPVAVRAIQELNTKIESLEAENKSLKQKLNKLEQLEARLSALENISSRNTPETASSAEE